MFRVVIKNVRLKPHIIEFWKSGLLYSNVSVANGYNAIRSHYERKQKKYCKVLVDEVYLYGYHYPRTHKKVLCTLWSLSNSQQSWWLICDETNKVYCVPRKMLTFVA
jgi:hypothetical protein